MNKTYQIDYDLRAPGRNYDSLIAAIKALGYWCNPLKSTWVVVANMTAAQLAAYLWNHMDANDGLLVTRLQNEAAWYGIGQAASDWLRDRVSIAA